MTPTNNPDHKPFPLTKLFQDIKNERNFKYKKARVKYDDILRKQKQKRQIPANK